MIQSHLATLNEILHLKYKHILGNYSVQATELEDSIESILHYYEDIISCMPGNVWWIDKNFLTIACNKNTAEMFGFKSIQDFKGLTFEDMGRIGKWSAEATRHFKHDTLEVLKTGCPKLNIEEPPIPHSNGQTIYFLTSRVPLFDRNGNMLGIVGISFDISELRQTQHELKKAKEQAEIAHQRQSEFIANMSHDIKTPLAGILGLAEILTDRLKGEDLDLARTILVSGRQLHHFLENCLEVYKLENNELGAPIEKFNLRNVIDQISHLFRPAVLNKNLDFNIFYDNEIPPNLLGSSANLFRILLNLISNAVKFTHQGHVTLRTALHAKSTDDIATIEFSIEDTGIGIPLDKQQLIFERFTKVTPSYKGIYEGSGIGLYFVKKLVEAMEGEIYVSSEEDVGSKFSLIFSFYVDNQTPPETVFTPENLVEPLTQTRIISNKDTPPKILLVEDNPIAQRMGSLMLTSLGCDVEIVSSGEKALEVFETSKYNLIFMDIGLPGIQGDMAAKLIRKMEQESFSKVPIIGLTAHIMEDSLPSHLESINRVISKPLSKQQARQILDEYYFSAQ